MHDPDSFERQARGASTGLVRELWDLVRHRKVWWLLPVIVVLLILGVLVVLSGTAAAPFIYTLF
jgi:hypothetical protein